MEESNTPVEIGKKVIDRTRSPWIQTVVISLVISAFSLFIYDHFYAPKIVAFDIKGYMADQRALYLSGKIDDAILKKNLNELQQKIAGMPKNKTIIMGDVVVSQTETLTP